MLYREIIAVCSEIYTKHINALWVEGVRKWYIYIYRNVLGVTCKGSG